MSFYSFPDLEIGTDILKSLWIHSLHYCRECHNGCLARITSYLRIPHFRCVGSSLQVVGVRSYHNLRLVFLTRALLNSRTGFEKSDNLVYYFTRRIIQLGLFAAIWSLAGMATWFLLPKYTVYAFFDMTAGPIYTHVSGLFFWTRHHLQNRWFRWCLTRFYPAPDCASAWRT